MNKKVKPCPKCGQGQIQLKIYQTKTGNYSGSIFCAECPDVKLLRWSRDGRDQVIEDLIARWNRLPR